MRNFKSIVLASIIGVFSSGAAFAENLNPEGIWHPANKESRYKISYCGDSGEQLCGLVHWIDPEHKNDENEKYLGTYLFSDIPQKGENQWRGSINFNGKTVRGTVTQLSADKMKVEACMLIWCESVELDRFADL